MKKVLILQLRPNDKAANGEFQAMLDYANLSLVEVDRVRMDKQDIPSIDLNNYSSVIVGGGPSEVSNPDNKKSPEQLRFEKQLPSILDEIVKRDFPYLGSCYGLGILSFCQGGVVSMERYSEDVAATTIKLTSDGKNDPILIGIPDTFRAFVGHKEACQDVPPNATLLASSEACPVQMLKFGRNVFATQFHPELDVAGIITRINVYKNAGYFPPSDADPLIQAAKQENIIHPMKILTNFIDKYHRKNS